MKRLNRFSDKQTHSMTLSMVRNNRRDAFCKKCVHKNFAKFVGKYLCWSLFLNKVGRRSASLLKKETPTQMLRDSNTNVFL